MFKNMKWNALLMAISYIAAGVFLCMYPNTLKNIICDIIGISVIVIGTIHIIKYLIMDIRQALYRDDFVEGIIMIFIGVLIIYEKKTFTELVPSLLAIYIIIGGFSLIQDSIDASRLGFKTSWIYALFGIISIIFGLLIMFDVLKLGIPQFQLIGGGFIYCGVTSLFSSIHLSNRISKYIKNKERIEKLEREAKEEKEPTPLPGDTGPIVLENKPHEATMNIPTYEEENIELKLPEEESSEPEGEENV